MTPRRFHQLCIGLVLVIAVGLYLVSGRPVSLLAQQQLQSLTPPQQADSGLMRLQQKISQTPQDSVLWAELGEYYLYTDNFDAALKAYQQALTLRGSNAELYAALATVLYYQAGQHLTPEAAGYIEKALQMDKEEVSALMLLAADAFMQADYARAIGLWQSLLDSNSPRVNRQQLIEAINMAKMLAR
ncbi:TPR domain-containing protein [Serratia aquatilis]|uniref:Tetratricopeptide repeat protein n=1 Tax=Serratia aquatilis TaxID=1737515 RepID=A0ABV6EE09_9GAMM